MVRVPSTPSLRSALAWLGVAASACGAGSEPAREAQPAEWIRWKLPSEVRPAFERVVLVTLDTLRADHLESYGYRRETAPFLARMAREGVLFERAFAAIAHTAPSHATMLTGLVPSAHGVQANGEILPADVPTLARLFGEAGFESAAFLNVVFLQGVANGFDHVSAPPKRAPALVDEAIEWLRARRRDARFFLWLHLYEPHRWKKPGKVPEQLVRAVAESGPRERGELYAYIAGLHGLPDPPPGEEYRIPWLGMLPGDERQAPSSREDVLAFVDDYDALIRLADAQVARMHAALEELALPGATLWILTSDHGEGLGSHGYAGHGDRVYNEQLRVPLVVHASDRRFGPGRVQTLVQHLDLFPTLAEVLGAELETPWPALVGRSLLPLLSGTDASGARHAFAERKHGESESAAGALYALQDARHKLIRHPDGKEQFYRLEQDVLELDERAEESPERAELRRELESRLETLARLGRGAAESATPAEWVDELRDLGYVR